jgi:hypothetical protein
VRCTSTQWSWVLQPGRPPSTSVGEEWQSNQVQLHQYDEISCNFQQVTRPLTVTRGYGWSYPKPSYQAALCVRTLSSCPFLPEMQTFEINRKWLWSRFERNSLGEGIFEFPTLLCNLISKGSYLSPPMTICKGSLWNTTWRNNFKLMWKVVDFEF